MTDIKTYPEMNEGIKYLLSYSEKDADQYALARIVELEKENELLKSALNEKRESKIIKDLQRIISSKDRQIDRLLSKEHERAWDVVKGMLGHE